MFFRGPPPSPRFPNVVYNRPHRGLLVVVPQQRRLCPMLVVGSPHFFLSSLVSCRTSDQPVDWTALFTDYAHHPRDRM